jgi:protein-tyrosine phosphatase
MIYWIPTDQGKLGIMPHPLPGRRLRKQMKEYRRKGVDILVSFLRKDEIMSLGLEDEGFHAEKNQMEFVHFPIVDHAAPSKSGRSTALIQTLAESVKSGKSVLMHCWGGIGRSGTVAVAILIALGKDRQEAITTVSTARRLPVPESGAQQRWLEWFAKKMENKLEMKLKNIYKGILSERYVDWSDPQNGELNATKKEAELLQKGTLSKEDVEKIYKLEYFVFRLALEKRKQGGWLPDRTYMNYHKWKSELEKLVPQSVERMNNLIKYWKIREERLFMVDERYDSDTGHGEHGFKEDMRAKAEAEDRDYQEVYEREIHKFLENLWNNEEPYKTVEKTSKELDSFKSKDIRQGIVMFHKGLTTAHNNGNMSEYAFSYAVRDPQKFLDDLSNGVFIPKWDRELATQGVQQQEARLYESPNKPPSPQEVIAALDFLDK